MNPFWIMFSSCLAQGLQTSLGVMLLRQDRFGKPMPTPFGRREFWTQAY